MLSPSIQKDRKLLAGDYISFNGEASVNGKKKLFVNSTRAKIVNVLNDGLELQVENHSKPGLIATVFYHDLRVDRHSFMDWQFNREIQDGNELASIHHKRIKSKTEFALFGTRVTQSMLVDRKRRRRYEKDKSKSLPNIFVLHYSRDQHFNELGDWLKLLKIQCKKTLSNFRAQLVIDVFHNHWAAIDVTVLNSQVFTLTIDAANAVRGGHGPTRDDLSRCLILSELNKYFSKGKHYSFSIGADSQRMQYTKVGCDVFAMEHASKLSKIDPSGLYQSLRKISSGDWLEGIDNFSLTLFLSSAFTFKSISNNPEAAKILVPLIAGTQSLTTLNALPEDLKQVLVGEKNQSLEFYVKANTVNAPITNRDGITTEKPISNVIKNKSHKRARQLIDEYADLTQDQFDAVMMFSSGVLLIENPRLLEIYNNPKSWYAFYCELSNAIPSLSENIRLINNKSKTLGYNNISKQEFLAFKVILFYSINKLHSYAEACAEQIELGRILKFSEYYPEDYLPEKLKVIVDLDLEGVIKQIEDLIKSMPLKASYSPIVLGVASKHRDQHKQMKEILENTKSKRANPDADNFNEDVEKHILLKSFVSYCCYIQENGKRSQEILESFSVYNNLAQAYNGA